MERARRPGPVRLAALLVTALVVLSLSSPAVASGQAQRNKEVRLLQLVNNARANHGLRPLKMGSQMRRKARKHSFRMAERNTLFHVSCLSCVSPKPFRTVAENVGYGGTVRQVHRYLMNSPAHRRNILCGCFKKAGMGVVRRSGRYWVTERFWG